MGAQPWAGRIVLGGAFALKHYLDYRTTHDCDAWWDRAATRDERRGILAEIRDALARLNPGAEISAESWGDVDSLKVIESGRAVFSFQIADRAVQMEPYVDSGWGGVRIETLRDNLGSKMCALVERGAPRDFGDIYEAAKRLAWTPAELWELWRRKNPDRSLADAAALVRIHLEGIVARRPLASITDPGDRDRAALVRAWFFDHLLTHGGLD
jgi:hypothetical protein